MNILFVAPRFHTNQIQILKTLDKENHKVFFHAIYKGKIENHDEFEPFIIKQNHYSKKIQNAFKQKNKINFFFPNFFEYFNTLKKLKIDICIIRLRGRCLPYLVAIICKLIQSRVVFYEQSEIKLNHLKKNNFINVIKKAEIFFRHFIFRSITVTPISKYEIKNDKFYYLPFVIQDNYKKIKVKTNLSKIFRILIIGKFQNRKRHLLAFEALNNLIKKYPFVKVTFIGEVSSQEHLVNYNKLQTLVNYSQNKKKFVILKNIKHKKISNFYKNSDLFILPSENEPASISILEATSWGLPVICSDTCPTRFYLNNKGNQIFKTNCKKDLKKKIEFFIKNINKLNKFININRLNAEKKISGQNFLNYFNKIFYEKK